MLSAALFLLANSLFLTLRLTGDTGSFPKPLSAGEERMYLERSLAGDLEARNILVEHNLRLVAHIIKKYYTQAAEQEDLISIGTIGLIKAVDTFRPERKIRLATYASRCVENEVLMYFRSRKKLQGEVSLSDTIEPDAAGGAPQPHGRGGLRRHHALGHGRPGGAPAHPGAGGPLPYGPGGGGDPPPVRTIRPPAANPAPGGCGLRHQPQLCIPPRLL